MCITKKEILELNDVIENINDFSNIQERDLYLKDIVEDVDLFINTLYKATINRYVYNFLFRKTINIIWQKKDSINNLSFYLFNGKN